MSTNELTLTEDKKKTIALKITTYVVSILLTFMILTPLYYFLRQTFLEEVKLVHGAGDNTQLVITPREHMITLKEFGKLFTKADFIGFRNYERVLHNEAFKSASLNTLEFAAKAVPLAVVLALLLAILLNSGLPGKSVFRSILLNPMMVPVASVVLIWQVFFSFNGVVNGWTGPLFGWVEDWLKSDYSQGVVLILFLWKNLGYNMVLFLAALNNIPNEILESAMIDGAGSFKRFFKIKMHYLSPTIFFVAIMSLISSFKIFREVYLLSGDYPYEKLYMLQNFMNNAFTHLDYSKLSAGAMVMLVVMVFIVGVLFFAESRFDRDVED